MNNIEHVIVFTFFTTKGIAIEAKWIIIVQNNDTKKCSIDKTLKIRDSTCSIIHHCKKWIIRIEFDNINRSPESRKEDSYINLPVTKTEVEKIKAIATNFIQPLKENLLLKESAIKINSICLKHLS